MGEDDYIEMLENVQNEAQRNFEQKLKSFRQISHKSERLIYINILLISSGTTLYTIFSGVLVPITLVPFALLGTLSIASSLIVHLPSNIRHGVSPVAIEKALEQKPTRQAWLETILDKGYYIWIREMKETHKHRVMYLKVSYILLFLALFSLLAGVFLSLSILPAK